MTYLTKKWLLNSLMEQREFYEIYLLKVTLIELMSFILYEFYEYLLIKGQ